MVRHGPIPWPGVSELVTLSRLDSMGGGTFRDGRELHFYAHGWSVVQCEVYRSASRQGLWLLSVSVDGVRLWHGEEWSREAALRRVADILTHLDAQEPAGPNLPDSKI